jgi:hypothetical protein
MSTKAQREQGEAKARLLEILKPGDTVFTILRTISRSGMQRTISLVVFAGGDVNADLHPNWTAAKLLGRRLKSDGHDAIVCNGAGMDMGFRSCVLALTSPVR